jgi:uncharacterized protein YodC (DUF2158 family)
MQMAQLNIGDSVILKSGGPTMTVLDPSVGSTGWVSCRWFDGKKYLTELFPPDSLRLEDDSDGGVYVA